MSTIINARSPYFLKYRNATNTLTNVSLDIRIWSGLKTSPPTPVTYTMSKEPLEAAVGNHVVFEISEIVRDYLETEYFTEAIDAVWVKVDKTLTFSSGGTTTGTDYYLALDGFGYFEEGIQPRQNTDPTRPSHTPMVLQSNMCVQFVRGRDIKIPVFSEAEPTISTEIPLGVWNFVDDFWQDHDVLWDETGVDQTIVDSDDSADKIQYIVISTDNARTGDTITFTSTLGNPQTQTITIEEVCERRYDAIRGVFYNKFGALQTIWFPQRSTISTSTTSESYNTNTVEYDSVPIRYSTYKHNVKRFNVIARQSINVNTAFLGECQNEPVEQLLMSEQVWLEMPQDSALETLPVIIKTSGQTRKTGVNDRVLIQYTFDFDFAYEKINNIR